jgi:ParB family chromosome partitioning protein
MSEAAEKEKSPAPVSKLGRGLGRLIPVKAAPAAAPASATPAAVAATVATTPMKPISPVSPSADGISTTPKATASPQAESTGKRVQEIEISKIRPNARQPRRDFDAASISELAGSIRSAGLLQPVILRPITGSRDQFELIAGERRLRACKSLDWTKIPAIVTNATDQDAGVWALIENVHRSDLNPMDRALSLKQLAAEFRLTHESLAEQVGLDRSSVTNLLRLAELDEGTATLVRKGLLSQGHAKALLGIGNLKTRTTLAESTVRGDWSVRALEREVQRMSEASAVDVPRGTKTIRKRTNIEALERKLSQALGTDVAIQTGRKPNTGKLQIAFYSLEQFEGLITALGIKPSQINLAE